MKVRIEKKEDGTYTAYNIGVPGLVAIGTGETAEEAKEDFRNSLEEMAELMTEGEKAQLLSEPEFVFDISSVFDFYPVINMSAFASRIGMNGSLLRQYKRGGVYISESQMVRIEEGIHQLGKELSSLSLTT